MQIQGSVPNNPCKPRVPSDPSDPRVPSNPHVPVILEVLEKRRKHQKVIKSKVSLETSSV